MRLLLVEDDPKLVRMLDRGLTEEGHQVTAVSDGEAGLAKLRSLAFDACVLDVVLPGLDGFAILEQARAAGISTPIVVLTARDAILDRVRGLRLGADDYLTKPFAFAELVARLEARARKKTAERPAQLRWRGITLDSRAHRVTIDGAALELSQKQFALLEFILGKQGEVLTRATLLEHVLGYAFDTGTNLVDVHVMHLRKRLGPAGADLVVAVRGVGYRVSHE